MRIEKNGHIYKLRIYFRSNFSIKTLEIFLKTSLRFWYVNVSKLENDCEIQDKEIFIDFP